jgi:isopenicillin N synthase-like dioxygenase
MAVLTTTTGSSTAKLPIIDFSKLEGFKNSDDVIIVEESVVEKQRLFQALKDVGFVYLKNHGIDDSAVQTLFAHAAQFFSQPVSEKEKVETGESKFFHGWFSPERTSGSAKFSDQKEAFDVGDDINLTRPNQWPADWPEFRTDMNAFFEKCHEIHLGLLSTLAEVVGLPPNYFLPYVQDKDHFFRVLHYPKTTVDTFKTQVRAGVHTDYGTLTLLFNDNNGGLQVRRKDGRFLDVPPIPGSAIINGIIYHLCIPRSEINFGFFETD